MGENVTDFASLADAGIEAVDEKKRYNPDQPHEQRYKWDTKLRIGLSIWVCVVSTAWLVVVAVLLFLQPTLSTEAIIALMCTATANVLGLPYIVLHGLFDKE